jgi:hypothetical protein
MWSDVKSHVHEFVFIEISEWSNNWNIFFYKFIEYNVVHSNVEKRHEKKEEESYLCWWMTWIDYVKKK